MISLPPLRVSSMPSPTLLIRESLSDDEFLSVFEVTDVVVVLDVAAAEELFLLFLEEQPAKTAEAARTHNVVAMIFFITKILS